MALLFSLDFCVGCFDKLLCTDDDKMVLTPHHYPRIYNYACSEGIQLKCTYLFCENIVQVEHF